MTNHAQGEQLNDTAQSERDTQSEVENEVESEVVSEVESEVVSDAGANSAQLMVSTSGEHLPGNVPVSGLHASQIGELQEQHARGLIEVERKASELKVDIQALDQTLQSLTSQARSANDAGVNITATHTQNSALGQTEIIVGNTQRAAAGQVQPFWASLDGDRLRTGLLIGGALLAGILLSVLFN